MHKILYLWWNQTGLKLSQVKNNLSMNILCYNRFILYAKIILLLIYSSFEYKHWSGCHFRWNTDWNTHTICILHFQMVLPVLLKFLNCIFKISVLLVVTTLSSGSIHVVFCIFQKLRSFTHIIYDDTSSVVRPKISLSLGMTIKDF